MIIFVLYAVAIVGVMTSAMMVLSYRNFSDYMSQMMLEQLDDLSESLVATYKSEGGWERLSDHPRKFHHMVRRSVSDNSPRPSERRGPRQRPGGQTVRPGEQRPEINRQGRPGPPHRTGPPPFEVISLFDADKRPVAGPATSTKGHNIRPLKDGDRVIGWLGMEKESGISHPLDFEFMARQSQALYIVGAAMLVLSAIMSLVLSKWVLGPVTRLAEATRALSSRQFDARIPVTRNDELGQLAGDFNDMAETLSRYEYMRKQWISDISHELRTPLAVLRGEIEALVDGIRPATPETLNSLHQEVQRLGKLVDDLHQIARTESGALTFETELAHPGSILAQCVNSFQTRMSSAGFEVQQQPGRPENMTMADVDRLTQLFSNLMENILRYAAPPGPVLIWESTGTNSFTLFVEDAGPGVPEEALPRLFDRLYRVDTARSRAVGGSGLGLSICKQIMGAHHGDIYAEAGDHNGLRIAMVFQLAPSSQKG